MAYAILADFVVLVHLAFIVFVLLGGFLALRRRAIAWVHLPAAAWGAAIEFSGWICPLTPLENHLRALSGGVAYGGDFVSAYLLAIVYPGGLDRDVQMVLGLVVVALNALAYALWWRQRPRPPEPGRDDHAPRPKAR